MRKGNITTNNIPSDPTTKDFTIPKPVVGLRGLGYTNGVLTVTWTAATEFDFKHYIFSYGQAAGATPITTVVTVNRADIGVTQPATFWCYVRAVTTNDLIADPSTMLFISAPKAPTGFAPAPP